MYFKRIGKVSSFRRVELNSRFYVRTSNEISKVSATSSSFALSIDVNFSELFWRSLPKSWLLADWTRISMDFGCRTVSSRQLYCIICDREFLKSSILQRNYLLYNESSSMDSDSSQFVQLLIIRNLNICFSNSFLNHCISDEYSRSDFFMKLLENWLLFYWHQSIQSLRQITWSDL